MGGLARRASIYAKVRQENPYVLTVDAGDYAQAFAPGQDVNWDTTEFMARMMARLKYDAWTPGERELAFGKASLLQLVEAMRGDVVSANITDKAGQILFKDRVVKTLGTIKVGITGVTSKAFFQTATPQQNAGAADFDFLDAVESLKPVVADLRKSCDVVLVLSHTGISDARRVADEVPGVDVLVVGHNPGFQFNPDRVGNVLLVQGSNRGQYVARLTLTLDADKKITDYKGAVDPLNEGVPQDPVLGKEVADFQAEITKRQAEEARKSAVARADAQGAKYLGDSVCARCHSDIYSKWALSRHGRAFQTLVAEKKQTDRTCVGCHVTGFGDPTGYQMLVVKDNAAGQQDSTDSANLRNVQCESCHGKGTAHGSPAMVTKVPKETCLTCHDQANDPKFDYDKSLAAGTYH